MNPDLHVTAQTPPTFLLQAEDDHVDNVNDSLAYYIALKNAGVPVEMYTRKAAMPSVCVEPGSPSPRGLNW